MSVKLTSYINFNGNAKDALVFYQSVFGGTVESDTFGEFNEQSGGAMPMPDEDKDKIMHATLTGEFVEIMVSDTPSNWGEQPAVSNIVLALNGDDENILRGYWDKLCVGGEVVQPLEKAPWGDYFGNVKDKFGISWMLDISPSESSAE